MEGKGAAFQLSTRAGGLKFLNARRLGRGGRRGGRGGGLVVNFQGTAFMLAARSGGLRVLCLLAR